MRRDLSPNGEFFLDFSVKALVTRSFATDVRPLFRDSDIEAMKHASGPDSGTGLPAGFDLSSYDTVKAYASRDLPPRLRTGVEDHHAVRLANCPVGSPRLGFWLVGGSDPRLPAVDGSGDAAVMPHGEASDDAHRLARCRPPLRGDRGQASPEQSFCAQQVRLQADREGGPADGTLRPPASQYESMVSSWVIPKAVKGSESKIAGRGLLAVNAISKHEVVAVKGGHLVTTEELRSIPSRLQKSEVQITDDLHLVALTDDEYEPVMLSSTTRASRTSALPATLCWWPSATSRPARS